MSFLGNLVDSVVSFANDSARSVVEEVVNPTVSFANDAARTVSEEMVNPTVSFANNAARTVVEEVVNPTVSFANDAARTVEEEVINPVVSIIQNQFQRPWDVLEQQQILDNLQESNGSHFPGDDYHSPDRKNWMAHLSVVKLTLNKIVWPGTHDSATNGIGDPVFTRWLGECQTLSIFDQLVLGTRVLDIRVQEDRSVCHGALSSYNVDVVLNDVIRFLSETQSEIIILEIRTEFGKKDPLEFETYLVDKLGQFLIHQDDNLFHKPVSEILPKRVICIWKPRDSPKPRRGGLLWNSDYLKDNWIDTHLPWTKFQSNLKHLSEQQPISSRRFFYRVENTVTPQADNLVVGVKPVTDRIRKHARLAIYISVCFQGMWR
ncbi:PLC-like phosphodiesterase TIM beta/alpha-barrel domain superfamily [Arabidopsis thaliana x Arabidopsis arenosa]|uniref:PLC-like phosphodiesterase TIM beta/alpha-barrel domain superfamily n=1 Tax=Arabidopsis thaliana x Arabidopsis arenosa TaxID=1240361 RepID=A0A8T1YAE3_9BRAS|nr:PLC-like phosphodiesterase TIM beta/alpha-barrel domain superfamily [Arabidopsis thaliana x Arabidopsis arenosa]